MAIKSGYASPNADANTRAIIESGNANVSISCDVIDKATQVYVIGRFLDGSNYLRIGTNGTNLVVQKVEAGAVATLQTTGINIQNGDHLEVEFKADKIKAYVNGVLRGEVTSTFNQTSTKVGLQATSSLAKVDNFSVKKV